MSHESQTRDYTLPAIIKHIFVELTCFHVPFTYRDGCLFNTIWKWEVYPHNKSFLVIKPGGGLHQWWEKETTLDGLTFMHISSVFSLVAARTLHHQNYTLKPLIYIICIDLFKLSGGISSGFLSAAGNRAELMGLMPCVSCTSWLSSFWNAAGYLKWLTAVALGQALVRRYRCKVSAITRTIVMLCSHWFMCKAESDPSLLTPPVLLQRS